MRVAIFTDVYLEAAGGIPSAVRAQKMALEAMGDEVVVFCPGFEVGDESGVVTVPTRRVRVIGVPMADEVKVVEQFMRRWWMKNAEGERIGLKDFDVVHVHYELNCSVVGARLAREHGIKLVQTMHGREDQALVMNVPFGLRRIAATVIRRRHRKWLPHRLSGGEVLKMGLKFAPNWPRATMWAVMAAQAEYADVVLTPSEHFAAKLRAVGVRRPVVAMPNGISKALLEQDCRVREWGGAKERRLKLVWNSRVSKEKRITVLIRAMKRLKGQAKLIVYGTGNDLWRAKLLVWLFGLQRVVEFRGQQPREEIFRAMLGCDLGVMASYDFDTQGMALLEAEAMGMGVVFCDPDMQEVVPKGGGVLAGSPDAAGLAAAILKVVRKPELVREMSEVMLSRRGELSSDKRAKKIRKIYRG